MDDAYLNTVHRNFSDDFVTSTQNLPLSLLPIPHRRSAAEPNVCLTVEAVVCAQQGSAFKNVTAQITFRAKNDTPGTPQVMLAAISISSVRQVNPVGSSRSFRSIQTSASCAFGHPLAKH
jgi:hypothetical protein